MAAICGLPADTIRDLARAYAAAKAPLIQVGGGLTRYGNGAMTVSLVVLIALMILSLLLSFKLREAKTLLIGTPQPRPKEITKK